MFNYKVNGALDIGNNGVKIAIYKNKKLKKLDFIGYGNIADDRTILLQEALGELSQKYKLGGSKFTVTLPASRFSVHVLEYYRTFENDEELDDQIKEDLGEKIPEYAEGNYMTQKEIMVDKGMFKKIMTISILEEEVERITEILGIFKIKVLRIIPDFLAIIRLAELIVQKTEKESEEKIERNSMIVDIGVENCGIFLTKSGKIEEMEVVPMGGNDFTYLIKEFEEISFKEAEKQKKSLKPEEEGDDAELTAALTPLFQELSEAIELKLDFFNKRLKGKEISEIILTGGGAKTVGFETYFNEFFDIPCVRLELDLLNLKYEKIEQKEGTSTFEISTVVGALMREVK
ncbi:MAG: pilus assembly protein PilM [Psychrilyobacter sp.]|nr:pilus assembly protein PilM [Psychrilyobacter sp.]